MDMVFIGKVIGTHGIKGEIKIRSDFKYKDEAFISGNIIYINEIPYTIISSRKHKDFNLILLDGFNNINDVLFLRGGNCYIERKIFGNKILNSDIIGFDVIVGDKNIGKLTDIINNGAHEILIIDTKMIPYVDFFVKKIDLNNKKIYINEIEGLLR